MKGVRTVPLVVPESGTVAYTEARTLLENLLGYELNWRIRRPATLWVVQGPGENWDDVSEEFQTRPIQAVMSLASGGYRDGEREVSIAVQPAHRGQGLATRLLRYELLNQYTSFTSRVAVHQREGLAFAAKHGAFESYDEDTMTFRFELSRVRLPHLGCSCSECYRDLDFANNRRG